MTANVNEKTGIAYGVISGNSVPYVLDDIITRGKDITQEQAEEDVKKAIKDSLAEFDAKEFIDELEDGEDPVERFEEHWRTTAQNTWDVGSTTARRVAAAIVSLSDTESLTFDIDECTDAVFDLVTGDGIFDNIDEHEYTYDDNGVHYLVGHLGGAMLIWVTESPYVTFCRQCSPCVPNAGSLDSPCDQLSANSLAYCLAPSEYEADDVNPDCVPVVIHAVDADGNIGDVVWRKPED
jgi:hypothetical protein